MIDDAYIQKLFFKYFNDPACVAVWSSWSSKLLGNIGTSLMVMEQSGPIPEEIVEEMRQALLSDECQLEKLYKSMDHFWLLKKSEPANTTKKGNSPAPYTTITCKQFTVDTENEQFTVIYGDYSQGAFYSIPALGLGYKITNADDIHANAEKLSQKVNLRKAYAIAYKIKELCGTAHTGEDMAERSSAGESAILDQPWINALTLSTRAYNCLVRNGHPLRGGKQLFTVRDVAYIPLQDIHTMRNCGLVTRKEIANALRAIGVENATWYEYLY